MKQKVLTVSVAAYNVERYIKQALDSFTVPGVYERVEVFVIDDGGTDKTCDIVKEYANNYPSTFILVNKKNGGWGSTVNYSINHATGKYFKLLDGDDYFESKNLAEYLDILEQIDADIIYTPYMEFDDLSGRVLRIVDDHPLIDTGKILEMDDAIKIIDFLMHNSTVKSSILKEHNIKISENCFYTDGEYIIKIMAYAKTVSAFDKIIYCYRLGRSGQSVSAEGMKKHIKDYEHVIECLLEFYDMLDVIGKKNICMRLRDWLLPDYYKFHIVAGDVASLSDFDVNLETKYPELYKLRLRPFNRKKVTCVKFLRLCKFNWVAFKIANFGGDVFNKIKILGI